MIRARADSPGSLAQALLSCAFAAASTAALLTIFLGSKQIVFAIAGAILLVVAGITSGNQRLFCFWGLILTVPLGASKSFLVNAHMGGASAITIDLCDVFLLPLLAFILRDRYLGRRSELRFSPLLATWGGLIALGAVDVVLGPMRELALLEVVRMIKSYLLFFVIINEAVRLQHFFHMYAALLIGIAIQAVFAILQYSLKANLGLQFLGEPAAQATESATASVYLGTSDIFRAGGLFSHPNLLAGFMALLLPICFASLISRTAPHVKAIVVGVIGLGMAALLITLSRSGWLSFAAGFGMLLALSVAHPKLRTRYVFARVLVVVGMLVVLAFVSGDIIRRFTSSDPGALKFRYEMMDIAWTMIAYKPIFGLGINSFVANLPLFHNPPGPEAVTLTYGENWPVVHNSYLIFWTQQGTVGFALLMGMYATVLWTGLRTARHMLDDRLYALSLGATCGIAAIMVDGIGSFFINESASLRVFWLVVGLIVAARYWTDANLPIRRSYPAPAPVPARVPTS